MSKKSQDFEFSGHFFVRNLSGSDIEKNGLFPAELILGVPTTRDGSAEEYRLSCTMVADGEIDYEIEGVAAAAAAAAAGRARAAARRRGGGGGGAARRGGGAPPPPRRRRRRRRRPPPPPPPPPPPQFARQLEGARKSAKRMLREHTKREDAYMAKNGLLSSRA